MEIPRRRHLPSRSDGAPRPGGHAELMEVIHPVNAVVAAEEIHRAVVCRPGWATPAGGYETVDLSGAPHAPLVVEVEHVIQPARAIIAAEHVHEVAVHRRDVAEARRWHRALVARWHSLPRACLEVERVVIVEPRETGVPAEQVHLVPVDNRTVVLATCRDSTQHFEPAPASGWEIEAIDIVEPAATTIATENVESVLVDDA
mmetsp:Transcript_40624/g.88788  ORF Transcript_40624/g.88788 Transcript_40624/m.88788 type:complete len:202 (-) Transcript_40624:178-783(-)